MGELHLQNQQQEPILIPNSHKQNSIITPSSSMLDQNCNNDDLLTMLHLNTSNSTSSHHPHKNSTKRPSPPSSSTHEPSTKKHSLDQEYLTSNGFSAVTLPISLYGNVLRRCISDPSHTSDQPTPLTTTVKGSGLPPLPPNLRRSLSDVIPSKVKSASRSENEDTTASDSLRLKRMKDRLREMKQWWDEVMKEEEEEQVEEEEEQQQQQPEQPQEEEVEDEKEQSPVAEEEKVLAQGELKEEFEEAVSVEWAEKCLRLTFKCPCGKGYEVLISANNCYYKLV